MVIRKKIALNIPFAGMLLFLFACQHSPKEINNNNALTDGEPENSIFVNLSPYYYPLAMYIPDSTRGDQEIYDLDGNVAIKVGEIFHISIGYGGNIEEKKQALKEDLLYRFEPVQETDSTMIYSLTLPDKSKTFYHFYAVKKFNQETYEIQDVLQEKEFSLKRIETMVQYVNTLGAVKPKNI